MTKPKAVLISDIHFTLVTLELATEVLRQAIYEALELEVPLILCGDTLDSKAIIRGEIANRLIELFIEVPESKHGRYILVGNHDLINEKSDEHSLHFLRPYLKVVDYVLHDSRLGTWLIPYQHSASNMKAILDSVPKGSTIICHTGLNGADMGHYVQDKTSLPREAFADFRVISGHYHKRQDIKCGRPRKGAVGLFSYVGNPYSLTFGEANDGPKGFQVLNDDGSLTFVPTNLRKHMIIERTPQDALLPVKDYNSGDLVWLKVTGPRSEVDKLNKKDLGSKLFGHENFKLDKIYTDSVKSDISEKSPDLTDGELMDIIIDASTESGIQKQYLKKLWREVF